MEKLAVPNASEDHRQAPRPPPGTAIQSLLRTSVAREAGWAVLGGPYEDPSIGTVQLPGTRPRPVPPANQTVSMPYGGEQ